MKLGALATSTALLALTGVPLASCKDNNPGAPFDALFAYFGYRLDFIATDGSPKLASRCTAEEDIGPCNFEEFTRYSYESRGSYIPGSFDPDGDKYVNDPSVTRMGNDLQLASWSGVKVDPEKLAGTTGDYKAMEQVQNRIIQARNQSIPSHYKRQFDEYNEYATNATQNAHLERLAASAANTTAKFKASLENQLNRDIPTKSKVSPLGQSYNVIDFAGLTEQIIKQNDGNLATGNSDVGLALNIAGIYTRSGLDEFRKELFAWSGRQAKLGRCLFR